MKLWNIVIFILVVNDKECLSKKGFIQKMKKTLGKHLSESGFEMPSMRQSSSFVLHFSPEKTLDVRQQNICTLVTLRFPLRLSFFKRMKLGTIHKLLDPQYSTASLLNPSSCHHLKTHAPNGYTFFLSPNYFIYFPQSLNPNDLVPDESTNSENNSQHSSHDTFHKTTTPQTIIPSYPSFFPDAAPDGSQSYIQSTETFVPFTLPQITDEDLTSFMFPPSFPEQSNNTQTVHASPFPQYHPCMVPPPSFIQSQLEPFNDTDPSSHSVPFFFSQITGSSYHPCVIPPPYFIQPQLEPSNDIPPSSDSVPSFFPHMTGSPYHPCLISPPIPHPCMPPTSVQSFSGLYYDGNGLHSIIPYNSLASPPPEVQSFDSVPSYPRQPHRKPKKWPFNVSSKHHKQ